MNKRLEKRHKRHVARAKQPGQMTEADLRTPESVRAAKEAGQHSHGRSNGAVGAHLGAALGDGRPQAKHREKVDVAAS